MKNTYKISRNVNTQALSQLYVIAHAGGNYSQYFSWNDLIDPNVETIFLELPNRGVNYKDQHAVQCWEDFIEKSFEIIEDQEKPAIFFGHSFGSLVAFELIKRLERLKNFKKTTLITSACLAPTVNNLQNMERISHLDDTALWNKIKKFGAITDDIINNKELSSYFIKGLRFDLKMMENFKSMDEQHVNCPIYTFMGIDDPIYSIEQMEEWKKFTQARFQLKVFPGDHFYLLKDAKTITTQINKILRE